MWNLLLYRRAPGEGRPANTIFLAGDAASPVEEVKKKYIPISWTIFKLVGILCVQLQARLHEVQGEVATVSSTLRSKSQCPEDSAPVDSDGKDEELTDKLDKLKSEFTQLLQEVRRRKSLLGDPGSATLFEVHQIIFYLHNPLQIALVLYMGFNVGGFLLYEAEITLLEPHRKYHND
jgi:hypothetical protein